MRDVEALAREAQRQDVLDKLHALRMSRMAWVEGKDVKEEFDRLQDALDRIDGPRPKRWAKTWTEALGRKKG